MVKEKFYVTTAIDYPNAEPHIGHAYQKIIADIFARWYRLQGFDTLFLTGTDEHGKKIQEAAEKSGKTPKEFVDELSNKFKEAWKSLNLSPDRFIRTTDIDHKKIVQESIRKCFENGDIYKGSYEGLYCVGCEAYYTEKDLVDGKCPLHNRSVEKLQEETYFFRLSKYQDFLLNLYEENPGFIMPNERRNEMINRVKEGLKDLSISRTSFDWGIPFPSDRNHVIYVWFDALFNYLSGSGNNQEYWPANLHLLGKDNGWFHAVYWPAFLKSAGFSLPETVFIHGFLTFNGQKISKSLGNSISPVELVRKYGNDAIRYYICRNFVLGEDGDFSESTLIRRNNDELADKLGNLVSRVTALAEKYGLKESEPFDNKELYLKLQKYFLNYQLDKALNEIFSFVDSCNEYVQQQRPWETQDQEVLWKLINAIKDIAILLSPFIPGTSEKIAENLGFKISLENLNKPFKIRKIKKSEVLFRKIEEVKMEESIKKENKMEESIKKESVIEEKVVEVGSPKINYDDFAKLDLRIGKIIDVKEHPEADKLYVLKVDLGESENRTIVAGLRSHYQKEDLIGKNAVFVTNLEPRKLRGIESNGMILAASDNENHVIFLSPEKNIKPGSKIR